MITSLALLIWIPVTLGLARWLPASLAVALSLLGASLLLPAGFAFDLEGMPALGRTEISVLATLIACLLYHSHKLRTAPLSLGPVLLILVILVGTLLTALSNSDSLQYGPRSLPGLTAYDALGQLSWRSLNIVIPFLLGLAVLRSDKDLRLVFVSIAIAALGYSLPILWEVRMSPHLHLSLYGYQPHDFGQQVRYGGYRPVVFIGHGLSVAVFVLGALLASLCLHRARVRIGTLPPSFVAAWLAGILVLCKSLGPVVLGLFAASVIFLLPQRRQCTVALALAAFVFAYPAVRAANLFPEHAVLRVADSIDEDRARSLETRLVNERQLLDRALERPWSGWGSWGRNRIFDPNTGRDLSITDGRWIIELGLYGVPGFVGVFGLLLWPVVTVGRTIPARGTQRKDFLIAGLSVLLAIYAVDLLPNSSAGALQFFLAGGLAALAQGRAGARRRSRPRSRKPSHLDRAHPPPRGDRSPLSELLDSRPDRAP